MTGYKGYLLLNGLFQQISRIDRLWCGHPQEQAALRVGPMDIGFGFMYGSSNSDASSSATGGTSFNREASARMIGLRGGLLMDMGSGSLFDAHVAFRSDKATDNVKFNPAPVGTGGEYSASGTELELAAGDIAAIPPGHDAWVVGNEAAVMVDIQGMANYAKK